MKGQASAADLIIAVRQALSQEAYPGGEKAQHAAFKHDKEKLRNQLQGKLSYLPAEVDRYPRRQNPLLPGTVVLRASE
jgi:hypothetical protein